MNSIAPLIVSAFIALNGLGAVAHGEGVLTADRVATAAGETLALDGREFEPGEEYQIKLVGTLEEFVLGTTRADKSGSFKLSVSLPREAKEGAYKLQAVADDGDISATLDVTLLAAAPVPNERSTEPMSGDMPGMTGPMAQAGEVPIDRNRGGAEWAIIGALIGLSAGLGLSLLSRRRA